MEGEIFLSAMLESELKQTMDTDWRALLASKKDALIASLQKIFVKAVEADEPEPLYYRIYLGKNGIDQIVDTDGYTPPYSILVGKIRSGHRLDCMIRPNLSAPEHYDYFLEKESFDFANKCYNEKLSEYPVPHITIKLSACLPL